MHTIDTKVRPVGQLLREWRERRRLSQLALAIAADISTRHLSFVETGRSRPTSDMILRLTEQLDVPLRERNTLLLAGGYAPAYPASAVHSRPMEPVRAAVRHVLNGHEPYPALVVDGGWNLVDANRSVTPFLAVAAPALLEPPVNALRLSLHPDGMAPYISNLGEWRGHLLSRLRRQCSVNPTAELASLYTELRSYPCDQAEPDVELPGPGDVFVPLRFRHHDGELNFVSTTTVFGTPLDVTVSELTIESFFPADAETGEALRRLAG